MIHIIKRRCRQMLILIVTYFFLLWFLLPITHCTEHGEQSISNWNPLNSINPARSWFNLYLCINMIIHNLLGASPLTDEHRHVNAHTPPWAHTSALKRCTRTHTLLTDKKSAHK